MKTAAKQAPEMVTRYQGQCQLCEGDFRLTAERTMVHHGFKRPGDGVIHGDCSGVGYAPYELSCELIKMAKAQYESRLHSTRTYLEKLNDHKVTTLLKTERHYRQGRTVTEYVELAVGVTEPYAWHDAFGREVRRTEYQIESLIRDIAGFAKRIADWTLKPVVEFDEAKIEAEKQAVRDARKAQCDAVKAEKKAHKAALQAKRDERERNKVALIKDFAAKFTALAETGNKAGAHKLCEELAKKKVHKFGYWYADEMQCDDALVKLGLAVEEKSSYVSRRMFRYYFQVGR